MNYDWYIELTAAVIRQAIRDLNLVSSKNEKKAKIGRDAYRFINGEGLEIWARMAGVDAQYLRSEITRCGKKVNYCKNCAVKPINKG